MRGVFDDDEEVEQKKAGRDTELTLGTGTVVLLLCGLAVVCGLCFGLGYALGHRATQPQQASEATHPAMAAAGSVPKPPATPPTSTAAPIASAAPVPTPSANSLWVQIAAVSHADDAEVLTSALRRRGYMVTARREPADNLIHVRIGPFATRDEAAQWRMRLLNDGYNAMIQP
jgi:cell division septation protein DedD